MRHVKLSCWDDHHEDRRALRTHRRHVSPSSESTLSQHDDSTLMTSQSSWRVTFPALLPSSPCCSPLHLAHPPLPFPLVSCLSPLRFARSFLLPFSYSPIHPPPVSTPLHLSLPFRFFLSLILLHIVYPSSPSPSLSPRPSTSPTSIFLYLTFPLSHKKTLWQETQVCLKGHPLPCSIRNRLTLPANQRVTGTGGAKTSGGRFPSFD